MAEGETEIAIGLCNFTNVDLVKLFNARARAA